MIFNEYNKEYETIFKSFKIKLLIHYYHYFSNFSNFLPFTMNIILNSSIMGFRF